MTSRGIRLSNPGNIRKSDTKWQGLAPVQSDPAFCTFTDPKWGIRAIARLMLTYSSQYGLKTVRGLIGRWAPPSENNTGAYVAAVCAGLKAAGQISGPDDQLPDVEIDVDTASVMLPLCKAICLHENGSIPYPDSVFAEGIRLAGVADAKPPPLASQHTFQTQVAGGVAVVGAAGAHVAQYAPTVKGWADQLGTYAGAPMIQHAVTVLLTVAGGLAMLGIVSQILKQKAA